MCYGSRTIILIFGLSFFLSLTSVDLYADKIGDLRQINQAAADTVENVHRQMCSLRGNKVSKSSYQINDYKVFHFNPGDEPGDEGYILALDSIALKRRIIIYDKKTFTKIEYFDVSKPKRWVDLEVKVNVTDCEISSFYFTEQGVQARASYAFDKNELNNQDLSRIVPSQLDPNAVTIAIVDSGYYLHHSRLQPYVKRDESGNFINININNFADVPYRDKHGHGVAGVASGQSSHLALLLVSRSDDNYFGQGPAVIEYFGETELFKEATKHLNQQQLEAVSAVNDLKARIVNMSFGSLYATPKNGTMRFSVGCMEGYKESFDKFPQLTFVISAGNQFYNIDRGDWEPITKKRKNVVVVGAVDSQNRWTSFSNYGKKLVDFAAVGKDVDTLSYDESRSERSDGTSVAAPYVSQILGEMLFENPKLSPEQQIQILCETVTPVEELKSKTRCGGVVNKERALQRAREM